LRFLSLFYEGWKKITVRWITVSDPPQPIRTPTHKPPGIGRIFSSEAMNYLIVLYFLDGFEHQPLSLRPLLKIVSTLAAVPAEDLRSCFWDDLAVTVPALAPPVTVELNDKVRVE
jgi:hypothetical protein